MAKHYCADCTPFTAPHTLATTPCLVSAKTFDKAYIPKKPIAEGKAAVAVFGAAKHSGIIEKIGKKSRRGKHNYVWFEDMLDKPVLASHCVGLPAPNEFVRHQHSGRWFKVGDVLAPTVSLFAVFVKKTANKTTVGEMNPGEMVENDKTAVSGADKTAVAGADKTAVAGADKTAVAAADTTAVAAADETAVAAADKTAVAADSKTADDADSKTADADKTTATGREILAAAMNVIDPVAAAVIREDKKKKKSKKKPTPSQGTPKKQVVSSHSSRTLEARAQRLYALRLRR